MAREQKGGTGSAPRTGGSRRLSLGRGSRAGAGGSTAITSGKGRSSSVTKASKSAKPPRSVRRAARRERFRQLREAFTLTRKADPRLVPLLAAALLGPFVLLLAIGFVIGHPIYLGILGLLVGLIVCTAVFGRRAQRSAFSLVEGQVGAAAAVVENMRGDWRVTPAVGYTREQDLVHRVLGRPGIVLVGEGSPSRVRGLITTEKRRLARFVGDTPVYDVVIGDGEGQVPLRGLERHFVRLPRNLKPKDVNVLDRKLAAMAPALPIPKGPMPTGRAPRGKVR